MLLVEQGLVAGRRIIPVEHSMRPMTKPNFQHHYIDNRGSPFTAADSYSLPDLLDLLNCEYPSTSLSSLELLN